jgi:hypothetical protein
MQCTYERNHDALSYNHFCSGKAIGMIYSECVYQEKPINALKKYFKCICWFFLANWDKMHGATIKIKFWVYVCSLRYPACDAHAPYCHLWPARFYNIFPTLSYQLHFFLKKSFEYKMCVLIFPINLSETFLIFRTTEREIMKNEYCSSCKVPVIIAIF